MRRFLPVIFILLLAAVAARAQDLVFKKGDQICFIGNSITMQGGFHHNIALFYATRFPGSKMEFYNCGISGNQAANVIARMDSDILIHRPNWSVIKLGMNDVRRDFYSKDSVHVPDIEKKKQWALDLYRKNYEIILQTPTIYEESPALAAEVFPGRNEALHKCVSIVNDLGRKYHLPVVDYWTPMQDINQRAQAADPSFTLVGKDREHPGDVGHLVMAYQFLKTTATPPLVSEMVIDSKNKTHVVNASLTNLKVSAKQIGFTALENALPFPLTAEQMPALKWIDFNHDLNREMLKIGTLKKGVYQLKIDGIEIGRFNADTLKKGINLALYRNTPQYQQAQKVLALFQELWMLEGKLRWAKAYQFGRLKPKKIYSAAAAEKYFNNQLLKISDTTSAAYKNLVNERDNYMPTALAEPQMTARMAELHGLIYQVNKPVKRRFTLLKVYE